MSNANKDTGLLEKETKEPARTGGIAWSHVRSIVERSADNLTVLHSYLDDFFRAERSCNADRLRAAIAGAMKQVESERDQLVQLADYIRG